MNHPLRPIVLLLLFAACLAAPMLRPLPALAEPVRVIYGFGREFPPFSYERDGKPTGFEVELLEAALKGKNIKLTMRPMDWTDVLMDLSEGSIHITSGMARTDQRMLLYDFGQHPTVSLKVKVFTQVANRVSNVSQLRGMRVAVQENTLYQRILEEVGGLNIKLYKDPVAGIKALANGDVEAYAGADKTTSYFLNKLELPGISPIGTPLEITQMYFAVNKDRPDVLEMINEGMRELVENGEYNRLFRKWFVPELTKEEQNALLAAAAESAINAYAPYSQQSIGAAVMGRSSILYTGCNVENGAPGLTASALMVAILKAVSNGESEFKAAAVVGPDGSLLMPTAVERRMLHEFGKEVLVVTEPEQGRYVSRTIFELLPNPYEPISGQ